MFGTLNFLVTNITLQISLLFLPTFVSTSFPSLKRLELNVGSRAKRGKEKTSRRRCVKFMIDLNKKTCLKWLNSYDLIELPQWIVFVWLLLASQFHESSLSEVDHDQTTYLKTCYCFRRFTLSISLPSCHRWKRQMDPAIQWQGSIRLDG